MTRKTNVEVRTEGRRAVITVIGPLPHGRIDDIHELEGHSMNWS